MIIDHADRLHVGVDDGGADEIEPAFFQVLADGFSERGEGGDFAEVFSVIDDGGVVDPAPEVVVERAAFLYQLEDGKSIAAG